MKNIETIYLLQNGNKKQFKIGYTTKEIQERVKELQTGNPEKLKVIKTITRDIKRVKTTSFKTIEKMLHDKFKDRKIMLEWFKLTDEDINFIKNINTSNYNEIIKILKTR